MFRIFTVSLIHHFSLSSWNPTATHSVASTHPSSPLQIQVPITTTLTPVNGNHVEINMFIQPVE